MQDEPLIWTTKGNLPVSELDFQTLWEDTEDYVKCAPTYWLKSTGELVKQDCHVFAKKGLFSQIQQGSFQ